RSRGVHAASTHRPGATRGLHANRTVRGARGTAPSHRRSAGRGRRPWPHAVAVDPDRDRVVRGVRPHEGVGCGLHRRRGMATGPSLARVVQRTSSSVRIDAQGELPMPVDRDVLATKVKHMYRLVAERPDATFHFELGRALALRLGYDRDLLELVPAGAV